MSEKYIYIDGACLAKQRKLAGFSSAEALALALRIDENGSKTPGKKTLEKYEGSSDTKPIRAFRTYIECIMPMIGVTDIDDLTLKPRKRRVEEGGMTGRWDAVMLDIEAKGHIEYDDDKRRPAIPISMRLGQVNQTLVAVGEMPNESRDLFTFIGQLREAGNRVVGDYTIANREVPQFGTVMLVRSDCGKELEGFYMGRGTVNGTKFALGTAILSKVGTLTEDDEYEILKVLEDHGCGCGLQSGAADAKAI